MTLSACCHAPALVAASHLDDAERRSRWYECTECGQPCDVEEGA